MHGGEFPALNGVLKRAHTESALFGCPLERVGNRHVFLLESLDFLHSLAYTGIDMQRQHHVNAHAEGEWPRSREVRLVDGQIHYCLAPNFTYKLVEAYRRDPHLRFLECDSDQQLVSFFKSWGLCTEK